jgi:anthranilate phosphoribosyltransferase
MVIDPKKLGLAQAQAQDLRGGDAQTNASIARRVLAGEPGSYRDAVVINAGAALWVAGLALDLAQGLDLARQAIDSGAAAAKLAALVELSQSLAQAAKEAAACS